ncbi:hypothetical protein NSTC745_04147 [Nostoc sp. DSM 114161]|uniref:eCIS core domain-containing protein n=1 Tax=Nostoc sp. DSM 114161 TaxID=3440143 RepID=UPI004045FB5B
MTSKKIAQTNQQQKNEASQASGILQRTAVRSVSDAGVQIEEQEAQPYSKSAFSKDFSRVPISTTQPQPIQAKLTIAEPGDKYEQEADRVASQVVQQINTPSAAQSTQGKSLQRQDAAEEEIQTKPSISVLQRSPIPTQVQLEAMPEDEELQAKSILQGRDARGAGEASTDVESAINSARGGGMPLDGGLQQSMGQAMGADFSGVKVHTDSQADQLNQSIQARAFTTGQDVFFREGEYKPGSRSGQELIAHELTHVVQQSYTSVVQRMVLNLDASDPTITMAADIEKDRQQSSRGRSKSVSSEPTAQIVTSEVQVTNPTLFRPERPLCSCARDEAITILAHGLPAMGHQPAKVAGLTANEMFEKLIKLGWASDHKGDINFSNCTSGWSRTDEGSFAEQFVRIIRQNSFSNKVTGFRSFVSSIDIDTEIEANYLTREYKLLSSIASKYLSWIGGMDGPETKDAMFDEITSASQMCFKESSQFSNTQAQTQEATELADQWQRVAMQLIRYKEKLDDVDNLQAIDASEEMENLLNVQKECIDKINAGGKSERPASAVEFDRTSSGRQRRYSMI